MDRLHEKPISRKEFLVSTGCIAGAGLAGITSLPVHSQSGKKADYRILGRTGLKVSGVGYGTVLTDGIDVLKKVIDSGVNFIDTGRMYANGKNEEMIGKALGDTRKKCIIQTKFHRKFKNDRKASQNCLLLSDSVYHSPFLIKKSLSFSTAILLNFLIVSQFSISP